MKTGKKRSVKQIVKKGFDSEKQNKTLWGKNKYKFSQ